MAASKAVKVTLLGDAGVGKTALLMRHVEDSFSNQPPELFSAERQRTMVELETVEATFLDTNQQDHWYRQRYRWFIDVDAYIICFSLSDPTTLESAQQMWCTTAVHFYSRGWPPMVLVGTHKDCRDAGTEAERDHVTPEKAHAIANQMRAVKYIECSAATGENVDLVFDTVVVAALQGPLPFSTHRGICIIL